jgi:hypothetical protein
MTPSRSIRILLAAPVALGLLALALPSDDVSFHPPAGAEVKKRLVVEIELKPERMEFTLNGESMPGEHVGGLDESALIRLAVTTTEKYVESRDGRPTDLLRTFDDLSLSLKSDSKQEEAPHFDRLEGKTVRFHWKDDGDAYERGFHESEGDDVLLLGLSDDMDLRSLLPGKNVSEGDGWDVRGARLGAVFLPGGLPGEIAGDEDAGSLRSALEEIQAGLAKAIEESKVSCKYRGSRDEGGVHVAVIGFKLTGKGKVDLSKAVESLTEDEEVKPEVDATATLALEGEGELLWDLSAGRVHMFGMQLEADIDLDMKAEADVEGEIFKSAIEGKVRGKGTWKLETSKP